jgi:hypothetical protein
MRELQVTRKGRLMIGQAGVFRVASALLLKGHVPSFPSVDTGVDILLDNGLRIQVKSRNMQTTHPSYPLGFYNFSVKENNRDVVRDWTKIVDFIVFWGINEDRYFIVPASEAVQNFTISPKDATKYCVDVDAMRVLRDKGMTYQEIAEQFGINDMTVARNLAKRSKLNSPKGNRHLASYEDHWDLLNIAQALKEVEQSSVMSEV